MPLTPEQRRADRAIIDAATPGPWIALARIERADFDASVPDRVLREWRPEGDGRLHKTFIAVCDSATETNAANAAFIARARESWPAALDALDERDQWAVDNVCVYRNLAIALGATPNQMLNDYDRRLCAHGIGDDARIEVQSTEAWDKADALETEVARLRAMLARVPHLLRRAAKALAATPAESAAELAALRDCAHVTRAVCAAMEAMPVVGTTLAHPDDVRRLIEDARTRLRVALAALDATKAPR